MNEKQRNAAFAAITVLACLAIVLVTAEIAVRLFVEGGEITPSVLREKSVQYQGTIFSRHVFKQRKQTFYDDKWRMKGAAAEINEKGYRGRDFEIPKPPGTIRIIVYGGSAAFDIRAWGEEDWPHRVERKLRAAGYPEVEVINAGIPGHTALESVTRLFTEGFLFEADYVLIYNAWNDLKYFLAEFSALRFFERGKGGFDPRIEYANVLDRVLSNVSHLYTVLRRKYYKKRRKFRSEERRVARGSDLPISALNPNAFRQYQLAMELFVDLARNVGAEPVLMTQARLPHGSNSAKERDLIRYEYTGLTPEALVEAFDRLDATVRDVAARKEARLIDASVVLSGKPWAFNDHVHLLAEGSEALAELTAEGLRAALDGRVTEKPSGQSPGVAIKSPAQVE